LKIEEIGLGVIILTGGFALGDELGDRAVGLQPIQLV